MTICLLQEKWEEESCVPSADTMSLLLLRALLLLESKDQDTVIWSLSGKDSNKRHRLHRGTL